jgi:hypothetical protein
MERVNRYLKQVRTYLPASQQDDIVRELEENLRSQVEDREAELGRPLDDDEQDELLRQLGSPLDVAGRYRTDHRTLAFGRQLIGPALFPFYSRVLRLNVGLTSVAVMVIGVVLHLSFGQVFQALLLQTLIQGGIVTAIFIAADSHLSRHPESWAGKAKGTVKPKSQGYPRFDAFAQVVAAGIFLLWLLAIRDSLHLFAGSAVAPFKPAPVWLQVYWPTVLLTFASMVQGGLTLVRPDWQRLRSISRLALNGAGVVLIGYLLTADRWVTLGEQAPDPSGEHLRAVEWLNHYLFYNLLVVLVIAIGCWLWSCRKEWRRRSATFEARRPQEGS